MSTPSIPPRRAGAHRPGSVDPGARVSGWLPDGVHVARRIKGWHRAGLLRSPNVEAIADGIRRDAR